ncbi:hypothetical protein CRM22_001507, partial [Opisthorchis felineus]
DPRLHDLPGRHKCSDYPTKMLTGLNQWRQSGQFCDVILRAGKTAIKAHRVVLATGSKYFEAMFSHSVFESCSDSVTINDVDEAVLVQLVNFLYTGEIVITEEHVEGMLAASDLLFVPYVRDACCRFLQSHLHPENCLGIFRLAKLHSCTELSEASFRFAEEHFFELTNGSDEFVELDVDVVEQLVSSDHLTVAEDRVFSAIRFWVEHDVGGRQTHAKRLFEHVRFGLLSRDYVIRLNIPNEFLLANPWCQTRLSQTLTYHLSPSADNLMTPDQFQPRNMAPEVLMIVGGWSGSALSSVECFNFPTGSWLSESDDPAAFLSSSFLRPHIPEIPRKHAFCGAAVLRKKVYVIGGSYDGVVPVRDVDIYDVSGNSWTQGPQLQYARQDHGVAVLNDKIYAVGGYNGKTELRGVEVFNISAEAWSSITPMSCARRRFGVTAFYGAIYAIGGENRSGILSCVEKYNLSTDSWTSVKSLGIPRYAHSACVFMKHIYVVGGQSELGRDLSTTEVYLPLSGSWRNSAKLNMARSFAGIVAREGLLYVVGGQQKDIYLDSVEAYNPRTKMWTVLPRALGAGRMAAGVAVVRPTP